MRISELESALLARFPREDAEAWDHIGLSVGCPDDEVKGILCALDVTRASLERARAIGANVLLTHHPIYLKAPEALVGLTEDSPTAPDYPHAAQTAYLAAQLGISVISLHTNLDRSREARELLPSLVGLNAAASLEHPAEPERPGLGSLADAPGGALTLGELGMRCRDAFGCLPRVWGAPETELVRVAFLGGSLGSFGEEAIAAGAGAIVTGEAGYHVCQDLHLRGMGIILLGHDRSEQPFVNILQGAAEALCPGVPIATMDNPNQWWTLTEGERSWA